MRDRRLAKRLRAAGLGLSAAAAFAAAAALLPGAVLAESDSGGVPADRQDYTCGGPSQTACTDPYQSYQTAFSAQNPSPDGVDIHVGANPDQPTFTSYLHLELQALPDGAVISSLKLTLHPTDDQVRQQENVNAGTSNTNCVAGTPSCNPQPNAAIIDAYPLKDPYPKTFPNSNAPAQAPAIDTTGPEAVGSFNGSDASWSFELAPMIRYWKKHGNTGLAVVPDAAATTTPWQVGFQRSSTEGMAQYSVSTQSSLLQSSLFQPSTTSTTSGGAEPSLSGLTLSPKAPTQGANAPPQAVTPPSAPQRVVVGAAPPKGWVPIWALVLAGSFAAAIALLANPVSSGLAAAGGLLPGMTGQLRLHPRMFAVAGVLLVWSSTVAIYGNTLGKQVFSPTIVSVNGGPGGGGGANGAPGAAGAAGGPGSAAAGAAEGGAAGSAAEAQQYANSPNPPSASLFAPDQETVGMTDNTIQLCAHAALTFGPAFNIGAPDLNVFWQMVNDQHGVWGRKLVQPDGSAGIAVQDDGYQPSKAVTAAQACNDQTGGDFFLLGGIGFDQIPAVRVWAEQHHMLYIHHIALESGALGLRYSFTMLPPLELVGQQFAQYYIANFAGQKLGIIERKSSNWQAGADAFKAYLKDNGYGQDLVADDYVNNNQGQYANQIQDMKTVHGAQVVLIWENALAAEQIIQQSDSQGYHPDWIGFPFNLTLQTLAQAGVSNDNLQKYSGMVPWPAYTCKRQRGDTSYYASYQSEIDQFEAAYAKYDPSANLCGVGGDLLFGTWEAWRQVYDLLYQCGRFCTRDKIAGLMLSGYRATVGANCPVDFSVGDHHHGGFDEDIYRVVIISGTPVFANSMPLCRRDIS